eukprot:1963676-Rhodomonas_salina.1
MDFEEYVQWEARANSNRPEMRSFTFKSPEFRRQFMDQPDSDDSDSDDSFDSLNSENRAVRTPVDGAGRSLSGWLRGSSDAAGPDSSEAFREKKTWWEKKSAAFGSAKNIFAKRFSNEEDEDDDDPYMAVSAEVGFAETAQRSAKDQAIAQAQAEQKEAEKHTRQT